MLRIGDTQGKGRPRVQDHALLRIELCELAVERWIEAAFVAVIPEEDRRMVYIVFNHLLNKLLADVRIVVRLPAAEFIQHIQSELVAAV